MVKTFCSNPFLFHKKGVSERLRLVSQDLIETRLVQEGQSVCSNCAKKLRDADAVAEFKKEHPDYQSSQSTQSTTQTNDSSDSEIEEELAPEILNSVLPALGVSAVKKHGLTQRKRQIEIERKLQSSQKIVRQSFEKAYDTSVDLTSEERLNSFENVLTELKEKFATADRSQKLQILTLTPDCLTITQTAAHFETSTRMVKLARAMKEEQGILPDVPLISKGRKLTQGDIAKVEAFYESDEVSRQCPGKKDFLSVKNEDGSRQHKQKRLILGNLREIFALFCEDEENPKIGFSTFCSLRPKHCVLAGQGGTHSVCVCTLHQNPKLQLAAIGDKDLKLEDVMAKGVCDLESEECMMGKCNNCPGVSGIKEFLSTFSTFEEKDDFHYKQWKTVDRCQLTNVEETKEEFLASFSDAVVKLYRHHFVSKRQSRYFQDVKKSLAPGQGILVGDFSENYSFVVQDAAQGFHWVNSQATLHPFVFYYKEDGVLKHQSFCYFSDSTKHTTSMVYTFLKHLVPLLKAEHTNLEKIYYFSDGCAAQYKNRFNFANLCFHKADFGVDAEWNFFATSHGKGACDGLGGTIKRSAARASLQRPVENQILTPRDLFQFCHDSITSIKSFFVSSAEVELVTNELAQRFAHAQTIIGTQKLHQFIPLTEGFMAVSEISTLSGENKEKKRVIKKDGVLAPEQPIPQIPLGAFVCIEDREKFYVASIKGIDAEFGDFCLEILKPAGIQDSYTFPSQQRQRLFRSREQIRGIFSSPQLIGGAEIRYAFLRQELQQFMR